MITDNGNAVKKVSCGRYSANFALDGKIVKYNESFCELTGYTPAQLDSGEITFFSLIPLEDYDAYIKRVEHLKKDGGGTLEHRVLRADGSIIYVICIGEDYVSEDGDSCVSITLSDITDKIKLQKKYVRTAYEIDTLINSLPGGIVVYKVSSGGVSVVKASNEYYRTLGIERGADYGAIKPLFSDKDYAALLDKMADCIMNQRSFEQDMKLKKDGKRKWIKFSGRYFDRDIDGCDMLYCAVMDISEAKEAERRLVKQNLCFRIASENTEDSFFDYDSEADTLTATAYRLKSDAVFEHFISNEIAKQTIHPEDWDMYIGTWQSALESAAKGTVDYRARFYDNNYLWYRMSYVSVEESDGTVANVYGIISCINHVKIMKSKIASDQKEIERLSSTDFVTGLYNRHAFNLVAAQALKDIYNEGECFAIVYSDINDFSYVNENFGYEAGDRMLFDFAEVIRQCEATVVGCRIYSDYYVSLYKAADRDSLIEAIGRRNNKFTTMQKKKYPLSDIQVSCGLYFIHSSDEDITIAMDNANLARRSVKGTSEIPCGIYTERMRTKRSHDQAIASEIWNAIKSGRIELFLQPKFDLESREIIGAEALARWKNPDGTYKLPYEFIDVLENVGYITQVDLYIYEQVLKCLAKWKKEGKKLVPVSVNFSRKHNNNPEFVDKITALANFYKVDKGLIEIEVTESCFTQDVKNLFSNMRRLREQGFKVDIDDFGTGYSSLSVLIDAPVDIVKVDKVFIDNIDTDERSREYVNQICSLIQSTRKDIIFEGVETEEQAKILTESGHTMAQGWLFDKAISIGEFENKYL